MAIREPYVRVTEQVIASPTVAPIPNSIITAGVVVSNIGPINPTLIQTQQALLDNYTVTGEITPQDHTSLINAYYLLRSGSVLLSRSSNTYWVKGLDSLQRPIIINMDSGNYCRYESTISIGRDTSITLGANYHIYIQDFVFYVGTDPNLSGKNSILWDGDLTNLDSFINSRNLDYACRLDSAITVGTITTYNYTIFSIPDLTDLGSNDPGMVMSPVFVVNDLFLIDFPRWIAIPRSLANADYITIETIEYLNDPTDVRMYIEYDGTQYLISQDRNDTDPNGILIFAEWINDLGLPFTLEVINDSTGTFDNVIEFTDSMGEGLGYDNTLSTSNNYLLQALNRHFEQEIELIDFVSDLNITTTSFHSTMVVIAESNRAESICSIPGNIVTQAQASNYRTATGISDDRAYFINPHNITTALLGFRTEIASGVMYIERVSNNKQGNIEFAPAFGLTNGTVQYSRVAVRYNKTQREALLQNQINTVIDDRGTFYINNNITAKPIIDILSEEQNRRTVNRISRDMLVILKQFQGYQHTVTTWNKVLDVIGIYMQRFIFNQEFRPEEYIAICDSTNNSTNDITNNILNVTLKVRYRNSVKYIEVLNIAYPIGVSF